MMVEWDRIAILVVSTCAAIPPGLEGYRLWKRQRYLAVAGVATLILGAVGAPLLLLMFG